MKNTFGRGLHLLFVSIGVFFIVRNDWGQALLYFGLGLAFDPFAPAQTWNDKPLWQKTVLLSELTLVLVLGVLLFFSSYF